MTRPSRLSRFRRPLPLSLPALPRGPRLLQSIGRLHALGSARPGSGQSERRRLQQLAIAQRLLDPIPEGLRPPDRASEQFWQVLRWGGLGLLLARLLSP